MNFFFIFLFTMFIIFIFMNFYYYNMKIFSFNKFQNYELFNLMNLNNLTLENNLILNKMYNFPTNLITIMLINYLFLTLIASVKITNTFEGPLRSKN